MINNIMRHTFPSMDHEIVLKIRSLSGDILLYSNYAVGVGVDFNH